MTDEPVARLDDVWFRYGRRTALAGLDLTIEPGITGLLGPNGAGKSTALSLVATRRATGSGRVTVLGHDATTRSGREQIRARTGFLPQRFALVGGMRVRDTVAYAAWAQGVARGDAYRAADAVTDRLDLGELAGRRVRTLSGGQRQRVGLATALVHGPELLVLDEPSAGLDPEVRMAVRRTLREIARSASVILSTHLVDDVLAVCDRIAVFDRGRVLFEGRPESLAERAAVLGDDSAASPGSPLERGYEAVLIEGRSRAS